MVKFVETGVTDNKWNMAYCISGLKVLVYNMSQCEFHVLSYIVHQLSSDQNI
jgi:hypothetical protein